MASKADGPNPGSMYKLKPYYDPKERVPVSDVVYKLQPIYDNISENEELSLSEVEQRYAQLEIRQKGILQNLDALRTRLQRLTVERGINKGTTKELSSAPADMIASKTGAIHDIVINADPSRLPLSVFILYQQLCLKVSVLTTTHVHSTVSAGVADSLKNPFQNCPHGDRGNHQIAITLIWKKVENGPLLMVNAHNQTPIIGEANVARYLCRLLQRDYDSDNIRATQIDEWLDTATSQLLNGNNKEKAAAMRALNSRFGKHDWLVGSSISLADIVMWSAVHQSQMAKDVSANVKKWLKLCNANPLFKLALTLVT